MGCKKSSDFLHPILIGFLLQILIINLLYGNIFISNKYTDGKRQ